MNQENTIISGSTRLTAALVAGKLIALLVTFGMPLFLTRFLSREEYGTFSQFYLVVFFFAGFFSLGMQSNLFYFYPGAGDKDRKVMIFQTFILLSVCSLAGMAFALLPHIGNAIIGEGALTKYRNLILAGIFLLMPVYILEPLYVVREDKLTGLLYPPAEVLLRLLFVVILAVVRPGLASLFTGIIISALLCYLFMLKYLIGIIGFRLHIRELFNPSILRKQLKYSLPFGVAVSLNILAERFDKLLCISFLTPVAYASYTIAFFGIPGTMQVYDSLSKVHLINMTLKYQENKISELLDIYKSLVTKTYSFSVPLIMIVLLYAKKIIVLLFTNSYVDSVQLFRVYLFSILIYMLGAGLILRATGKTVYTFKSYIYSGMVTVPATYFLIRYFGVWGAMSGALLSITLNRIFIIAFEMKITGASLRHFLPWKNFAFIFLIAFLTLIPFLLCEIFFDTGILSSLVFGIIYMLAVSYFEIRKGVFVLESGQVKGVLRLLSQKLIPGRLSAGNLKL